jgi:PAS domain S-box-containing protein
VIYVFRDGSAVSRDRDDWTDSAGVARLVTDSTGRYVAANDEAATLFGVTTNEIIGRPAGSFTRPQPRIPKRDARWHALEASGRLYSLTRVQPANGSESAIEFVTIKDGDGPGRNVTFLRSVT